MTIIESQGAEKPRQQRTHTDIFSGVTSTIMASSSAARSFATAIRADQGEAEAYKAALLRGEIGIQRPTGANIAGVDFITAIPVSPGSVQIREIVKYTNYKRFGSKVKITYEGQEIPKADQPNSSQPSGQQPPANKPQ